MTRWGYRLLAGGCAAIGVGAIAVDPTSPYALLGAGYILAGFGYLLMGEASQ